MSSKTPHPRVGLLAGHSYYFVTVVGCARWDNFNSNIPSAAITLEIVVSTSELEMNSESDGKQKQVVQRCMMVKGGQKCAMSPVYRINSICA